MIQKLRKVTYTFAGNEKTTGLIRQIKISSTSIVLAERAAMAKLNNPRLVAQS